jgi:hypothetical protein
MVVPYLSMAASPLDFWIAHKKNCGSDGRIEVITHSRIVRVVAGRERGSYAGLLLFGQLSCR